MQVLPILRRCGAVAVHACRLGLALAMDTCGKREQRFPSLLASSLETFGGAFLKAGQVLASRPDVVSPALRTALAHLCDRVRPLEPEESEAALRNVLIPKWPNEVVYVDARPFASGSVAQLHRVELRNRGGPGLIKVIRPDAPAKFHADLTIMMFAVRCLARIPWFAPFSLDAAFAEIYRATTQQLDLQKEHEYHAEVEQLFAGGNGVLVPALDRSLYCRSALVMQYVAGARRIDDTDVDDEMREAALTCGLRAVYTMLFDRGLMHCDLHPGNLLITADGTLVLLDFGYMSRMDDPTRRLFAALFLAIATNDARRATRVILESAAIRPPNIDEAALESDVADVLRPTAGAAVGEFRIAPFVLALFEVQRKHGIRASSAFVMAIMSLLTYEGLLCTYAPSLDFQREAVPYVLRALQEE